MVMDNLQRWRGAADGRMRGRKGGGGESCLLIAASFLSVSISLSPSSSQRAVPSLHILTPADSPARNLALNPKPKS
jgi:hypothetical protein